MVTITNIFGVDNIAGDAKISITKLTKEEASQFLKTNGDVTPAMDSFEMINITMSELKYPVIGISSNYKLEGGEKVLYVKYKGPELQQGAKQLPEGGKLKYYLISAEQKFSK